MMEVYKRRERDIEREGGRKELVYILTFGRESERVSERERERGF
jgi:hypothetical protein